MTPYELPADMEAVVYALDAVEKIGEAEENFLRAVALFDAVNRSRALLKAYQEQRRALERIEQGLPEIRAVHRFSEARLIARAALNQKGDER
jgi:hypothetical protein